MKFRRDDPACVWLTCGTQQSGAIVLLLLLTGCTGLPKGQQEGGLYDALYAGKSDVAYATALPVASAAEAIQLGDAAFREGDLDRALFNYIRALNKEGDNADALYMIGVIHAGRGNTRLAETAYRWALRTAPEHAGALSGLGIILMKRRDYEQAGAKLRAAVQRNPRLPDAHNALGVLADMQRDYARAQAHYQRALALIEDSPEFLNNLGYSRYLSGDRRGAIAAFEQALRVDPRYQRAWRNLGLVYAKSRDYDKALDALSKVQDLAEAYNDVGYVAMLGGRLADAEIFFAEAMRLSPQYYARAGKNAQRLRMLRSDRSAAR